MWEKGIILFLVSFGCLCSSQNVDSQEGITNCTCGRTNYYDSKYYYGRGDDYEAFPNEHPHVVVIRIDGQVSCSGSIITSRHVLTSASCTFSKSAGNFQVVVGENTITTRPELSALANPNYTKTLNVAAIKEHPDYNPITTTNDISIIVTKEPILFNWAVGPICLPKSPPLNLTCRLTTASGWGPLYGSRGPNTCLRKVSFKILPDDFCAEALEKLDKNQICIGPVHCSILERCIPQTDTGSGFYSKERDTGLGIQIGILSSKIHPNRHDSSKSSAAQTAVIPYIDWIQRVLDETKLLTGDRLQTCSLLKENPDFYY